MGEFSDVYLKRANMFIEAVKRLMNAGYPIKKAVDMAWKNVRMGELIADNIAEGMIKAIVVGRGPSITIGTEMTKDYILGKWLDFDKVPLSKTLYQNEKQAKKIIKGELEAQIKLGRNYKYAAQFLQDNTGQFKPDAPKYLDELYQAGKRALAGDMDAQRILKGKIKSVQRQIDKLSPNGSTDRLVVAYQDLLDAVESGNTKAMDKRLRRAVEEKARYQAERVARTEIARAYGDAKMSAIQKDEDATGWRWILSSAHHGMDICDFNAEADLYGMGEGTYPINRGPEYPAHPHCTCILRPFYKEHDGRSTVGTEAGVKYLKSLDEEDRVALMGATDADAFKSNPDAWRSFVTNYEQVEKRPQIKA
jgi:hypothetical protein